MKVLQFEPWTWNDIVDYPDLGAAMLMGAYQNKGMDAVLICTQLVCIDKLFNFYADENAALFNELPESEKKDYKYLCTIGNFREHMLELYCRYYSKSWECYFDASLTEEFRSVFLELIKLNFRYLKRRNSVPLTKIMEACISENPCDLICISMYEYDKRNQLLLSVIKEKTNIPVCIGGAFTGHLTDSDIIELRRDCAADYLSIGPGENNLVELVKYIESGYSNNVPENIVPLHEELPFTLKRVPIKNLNMLNDPCFNQSEINKYASPAIILPLQSARGCTWRKCTFCSHHRGYYDEYHCFDIEKLVNQIEYLSKEYQCRYFVLHDDDIPSHRIVLIGKELLRRNLKVNILAYARADNNFLNDNILDEIYQSGFKALSWGIESGSQRILDKVGKGISVEIAEKILCKAREVGISNTCWMMINIPDEEDDDFNKTIRFMASNSNSVDLWLVSPFRLQYDSTMYIEMFGSEFANRKPFATSMPPTYEDKIREEVRCEKMNSLFANGSFENGDIPISAIPISSQRSRLIPFFYRTDLTDVFDTKFQLVSNCNVINLGKTTTLRIKNKKITLNAFERDMWNKLINAHILHCSELSDNEVLFCSKLLENGWCRAYYIN